MRARLDVNGSPEYELTWKHWDTESDAPICALRASARRISDKDFTGWPTTDASIAQDGEGLETWEKRRAAAKAKWGSKTGNGFGMPLTIAAKLSGWDKTPQASDGQGGVMEIRPGTTGKYKLRDYAHLAGFNTQRATDGSNGGPNQANGALSHDVSLAGWPTANKSDDQQGRMSREAALRNKSTFSSLSRTILSVPGTITELFLVPTGRRAVLAPEFSLWLMGFPEAWTESAPGAKDWLEAQAALALECSRDRETPSSLSSRRSS